MKTAGLRVYSRPADALGAVIQSLTERYPDMEFMDILYGSLMAFVGYWLKIGVEKLKAKMSANKTA